MRIFDLEANSVERDGLDCEILMLIPLFLGADVQSVAVFKSVQNAPQARSAGMSLAWCPCGKLKVWCIAKSGGRGAGLGISTRID